jgi:hypothetical protein
VTGAGRPPTARSPIVRTMETSTLLDSGMDVYFPREVTESEEAAETGASPPWDAVELRSETARLETEEIPSSPVDSRRSGHKAMNGDPVCSRLKQARSNSIEFMENHYETQT